VRVCEALASHPRGLLYLLTYHRIDYPNREPGLDPGMIGSSPEEFDVHIRELARRCRPVGWGEVEAGIDDPSTLPPRAVHVTFDDAYEDFALHAWPVLRRHGVPATLFVATRFPDRDSRGYWWDRLHRAIRLSPGNEPIRIGDREIPRSTASERDAAFRETVRLVASLPFAQASIQIDSICSRAPTPEPASGVLDWATLRRLKAEGLTLAPHSRTHPLMHRMTVDAAADEALGSLRDLEREIGPTPAFFAYPGGAFSPELPKRLASIGFKGALTTRRGVNDLRACDRFLLRRTNVGRSTSSALVRAELLPWIRLAHPLFPLTGSV